MSASGQLSAGPANEGLLPALRVPLFLIVLGCMFLAEDYWGWRVSRTWPVLLIMWGALLAAARRPSES